VSSSQLWNIGKPKRIPADIWGLKLKVFTSNTIQPSIHIYIERVSCCPSQVVYALGLGSGRGVRLMWGKSDCGGSAERTYGRDRDRVPSVKLTLTAAG
jgi:hypothetical protein